MRYSVVLLLVVLGCLIEQMAARSLIADLLILKIVGNIIKPRFVPLPLPLPLPIKFTKHTHKAYPVPIHGHSFSAHHLDSSPLSFHLGGGYDGLLDHHDFPSYGHDHSSFGHDFSSYGHDYNELSALTSFAHDDHHDFSSLASIDQAHHGFSDLTSSPGHYKLTSLPSLPLEGQLAVGSLPSEYASASHLTPADRQIIQSLVDAAELTKVPAKKHHAFSEHEYVTYDDSTEVHEDDSTHLQLSAANDEVLQNLAHASEVGYEASHSDTTHDINAVGGFDFLTDLHDAGESHDWWK